MGRPRLCRPRLCRPQGDTPRSPFIPRVLIECPRPVGPWRSFGGSAQVIAFLGELTACGGDIDINQMSQK